MALEIAIRDRIAGLRRETGEAQIEAATAIGISRSYLAGIETGADTPGIETFIAIADYYRVSLEWLARGDPYPRPAFTESAIRILAAFGVMPEDEQAVFITAMEFRAGQLAARKIKPQKNGTGAGC